MGHVSAWVTVTTMKAFEIKGLLQKAEASGQRYSEFLRVPELSMGLYRLKAGETDPHSPHKQDEVYYVLEGRAEIELERETRAVAPGSIVYVAAWAGHKFFEIEEDLTVLVFFAPAES